MSGTYKLRALSVTTNTNTNGTVAAPAGALCMGCTLPEAVFAANDSKVTDQNITFPGGEALLRYNTEYYLDGAAVPTPFGSLPPGFTPTSASIRSKVNFASNGTTFRRFVQFASLLEEVEIIVGAGVINSTPFPNPTIPSALNLLNNGMGIRHLLAGIGANNVQIDLLEIEGNYDSVAFQYTLDPAAGSDVEANTPDINGEPANNGTLITIESDPLDPTHLLLDELTISVTCGSVIIKTQTETLLEFWIPSSCSGSGSTNITATGNGVQFSGSVNLGALNILETDGSGIYVITPGKTNDTLYSSERDGTTRDVKIPNPLGKTGFVGG